MTEYLRVTPTSEQFDPQRIPRVLESLHKLTTPGSSGLVAKLNPLQSDPPPRFEFLVISEGADDPVEFLYGADAHLDTLEKRLRSIYPATFDIERVEIDVAARLIPPLAFTPSEFVEQYQAGQLQYEFGPAEQHDRTDGASADADGAQIESRADGGAATDARPDHHIVAGESVLELAPPDGRSDDTDRTAIEKPTMTADGRVLARPTTDAVDPLGVRWYGSAAGKQDWMTSLTPFTAQSGDDDIRSVEQPAATLASLIDHLIEAPTPVAFQVVFQRRASWQADAELRKENIEEGRDNTFQKVIGPLLEAAVSETDQDDQSVRTSVDRRIDYIDAKSPMRSFTTNIRVIGVPTDETRAALDDRMESLLAAFDPLDGPFYGVAGRRLRASGIRTTTKRKRARAALQRLLDRELATGRGTTRPDLILGGRELANFVVVPSAEQLTVEATRGTRAEPQSRNPLPSPNPDLLDQFQEGMAIGYPLGENGAPRPDPIRIPPELLTTHYGRFASTGSGKSKAIINDALSLRETTGGPVVIVDPKGDGMCENYLRCHYARFRSLDDVCLFRVPETIPAFSFFDIRPALAAGRPRADAIQDTVDHFHDILAMIMGREQHDQAFVANDILSYLIKALFDAEYGGDVFGLDDLFAAALRMQRDQTIPPLSTANQPIEESLTRHFAKDTHQFQVSMDAVGNRLDKLKEDAHLRRIFSHTPEQNGTGDYVDNRFDFRTFLDEDVTLLFDLGDLRPASQRAITLLLLSNLWDAVQVRRRDGQTTYDRPTNLIIEEAAPIAATNLVAEQLLPQGRSFGLSMGLVMQFPEQVRNRNARAYDEVLNNIKTKLIGNISIERDLAESLAHEDLSPTDLRNRVNTLPSGEWIAQLPSPSFGETGPAPFSLQPLPIAPGHPESDQPLTESQEDQFESVARPRMIERTRAQYGLAVRTESRTDSAEEGWGSSGPDRGGSSETRSPGPDPAQSSFIEQPTMETESTSDTQKDTPSAPGKNAPEFSSLFGASPEDEEPAGGSSEEPENRATPVRESDVAVPDNELRKRGLSREDARFLSRILDVMNREAREYTLLDSMRSLRDEFEELHLQRLRNQNLVEEGSACGRKYYTVLPAGRELLGQKLQVGPGRGDIGEKTPHKVGVRLLERWLHEQDDVTRVEPYYEHNDDTVFDVAGFDAGGNLVWVGEAELPSNNTHAPVDDYDKLCSVDADAIWAFNNRETAIDVIETLAEADRLEEPVSGREARSFSTIRDAVADFDAPGMTTVRGFKNLDQEVTQ